MRVEPILQSSLSQLAQDDVKKLREILKDIVTELRECLITKTISEDYLSRLAKDVKAVVDFILAPQEYTVTEIQQLPTNKLLGKVATLALEAITYFSLCLYQLTPQPSESADTPEESEQHIQELVISNKKLIGEVIIDPYYERSTDKAKTHYPCGHLKVLLPIEFHLMAITLFKLLCPLLKSLDKKATIVTKLITLIHVSDYFVRQVKVKTPQPRIAIVGGPSNALSILFNSGSLLDSDVIFNRDSAEGARKLPVNENHLESARNIYFEYEYAIRLQHTKQDEGKGLMALAQKLQSVSPSFDSLSTLARVSDHDVPLCIEASCQYATTCFLEHCNLVAHRFRTQMIERIQKIGADVRHTPRLKIRAFDSRSFLSDIPTATMIASILAQDSFQNFSNPELSFGYQPILVMIEEYVGNRPAMLTQYLASLLDLLYAQPHVAFAAATALRKASLSVKQAFLQIIDSALSEICDETQLSGKHFSICILELAYLQLIHMHLPTGFPDTALIKRTTKLSIAYLVLQNTTFLYSMIICFDMYASATEVLLRMILEDAQKLCQDHKLGTAHADTNTVLCSPNLNEDEQCTALAILFLLYHDIPVFEVILVSAPVFPLHERFSTSTVSSFSYLSCALNVFLGLTSLQNIPSDEELLQKEIDHTSIFSIQLTAAQCMRDQSRIVSLHEKFMRSILHELDAILKASTAAGAVSDTKLQSIYHDAIEFLGSFQTQGTAFESRHPFIDHLIFYLATRHPTHVELLELLCRQMSITAVLLWPRISPEMQDTFCKSELLLKLYLKSVTGLPDYISSMRQIKEAEITNIVSRVNILAEIERTGRTPEHGQFSILTPERCREELMKARQKKGQLERSLEHTFLVTKAMRLELFSEQSVRDFNKFYGLDASWTAGTEYTQASMISVETAITNLLKYPKYHTVPLYKNTITTILTDRELIEPIRAKATISSINMSIPEGEALKKMLEQLLAQE